MTAKNNKSAEKGYRLVQNEGKITFRIEELWDGGVVRNPFGTKEAAVRREEAIARAEGFIDDLVLKEAIVEERSPCEAFEKDADGNWYSTKAISINIENRMIVISAEMTFTRGDSFMRVDVAKWLDENCSQADS